MVLIKPINYARISLIIGPLNIEFGVRYGTVFFIFILSIAIYFRRVTDLIKTNEDNDPIKTR